MCSSKYSVRLVLITGRAGMDRRRRRRRRVLFSPVNVVTGLCVVSSAEAPVSVEDDAYANGHDDLTEKEFDATPHAA